MALRLDENILDRSLQDRAFPLVPLCHLRELLFPLQESSSDCWPAAMRPHHSVEVSLLEEPFKWTKCAPAHLGKGQKGMWNPGLHVVGLVLLNPNGHLPNLPYWSPQPRWIYKKNFLLKISAHGFQALQHVLLVLRCPWGWCPRFPLRIWKLQVRTELMLLQCQDIMYRKVRALRELGTRFLPVRK